MELVWREQGGPKVASPTQKGFGSKLIESALTRTQGRAQLHFEPDGLRCGVDVILE